MTNEAYRIVNPDWSEPRDVIAIEHEINGGLCLVAATTLGFTLAEVLEATIRHSETCVVKNPPPPPKPSKPNCCCAWGAAVRGEWPEFPCRSCEIHGRRLEPRECRRHRTVSCKCAVPGAPCPNTALPGRSRCATCAERGCPVVG